MILYCFFMAVFMFWWSSAGIVFTYLYNKAYDNLEEVSLSLTITIYLASVFWFFLLPFLKYSAGRKGESSNDDEK